MPALMRTAFPAHWKPKMESVSCPGEQLQVRHGVSLEVCDVSRERDELVPLRGHARAQHGAREDGRAQHGPAGGAEAASR